MSVLGFILGYGNTGRGVKVDANGAIIANAGSGTYLPLEYGQTGRASAVDASGRLMVNLDGTNSIPGINVPFKTLTWASGMSVDMSANNNFYLAMGAQNTVIQSLLNPVNGAKYLFVIKQNNAGSKTLTFPSSVKWVGGTPIALTAASGSIDACTLVWCPPLNIYIASPGLDIK